MLPCGLRVKHKLGNHPALITARSERFNNVQYELTYCCGPDYKTIWANEEEFEIDPGQKEIGFDKEPVTVMSRDSFIRKWLGAELQYNEDNRDKMRDDLDLVIAFHSRQ